MIIFPNAKINLGLHITEKRPDGYHNLETVFYPIPLCDALEVLHVPVEKDPTGDNSSALHFYLDGLNIEGDPEKNLVCKAYYLLAKDFDLPALNVHLLKNIPTGAGLGGGSADATFMLKAINTLANLELSDETLESYALKLGADCPIFVRNKTVYAEGIGEIFTPIEFSLEGYQLLLVKPDVFVSTKDAFAQIKPFKRDINILDVIQQPIETWRHCLVNDFEGSVFSKFPELGEVKDFLYEQGALYAAMSGSGATVFGIFSPDADIPTVNMPNAFVSLLKL